MSGPRRRARAWGASCHGDGRAVRGQGRSKRQRGSEQFARPQSGTKRVDRCTPGPDSCVRHVSVHIRHGLAASVAPSLQCRGALGSMRVGTAQPQFDAWIHRPAALRRRHPCRDGSCLWVPVRKIKVPKSANFKDYAAMAYNYATRKLAVLSQEDAAIWVRGWAAHFCHFLAKEPCSKSARGQPLRHLQRWGLPAVARVPPPRGGWSFRSKSRRRSRQGPMDSCPDVWSATPC